MIVIETAKPQDAEKLTEIAIKAFLDDNKLKPVNASMEGPPGHNKVENQRKCIKNCYYYKASYDGSIVGGGFAWKKNEEVFHIDGMFIDPEYQNKGIGSALIETLLNNHYPKKKWTLETPSFSKRNHHFYEKFGFVRTKEVKNNIGWIDYHYEKLV